MNDMSSPPIGHNRPPEYDPDTYSALKARVADFSDAAGEWLDLRELRDEEQASKCKDLIDGTRCLVSEIDAASEEQRQGSAQINIAVSELDSATQQNAGLVEETASASEEIANQAQELLATMERFKIRENIRTRSHDEKHKEMHLHAAAKQSAIKSVAKKPAAAKAAQSAQPEQTPAAGSASGGKIEKILSDEGFEQF